jgi:L-amino acid N-acyltransferase YncA
MLNIRKAVIADLVAITEIYNDAVLHTVASFDTEPKSMEKQREWFEAHDSRLPILVAEMNGQVAGWASLSQWSDRCAYSATAEASLYVREGERCRGTGKALLTVLLNEGQKAGLHTVIARIVEGNEASIHICESLGFTHIGTMREVGRKFGELLDVHMLQKMFADSV